jgi:diaminohydroxyphosphoribosylaminopyrimidine deaminase/5-amino-6-(5-phosphoribosylamino)uracil reductase
VAASFVRERVADEFLVYVAPALLGGDMLALRDIGVTSIGEAVRLTLTDVERLGDDLLLVASPAIEGDT